MNKLGRSIRLASIPVVILLSAACGAASTTGSPPPAATASPSTAPSATEAATASPAGSPDWLTALTLVPCPTGAPTPPTCIDSNATDATPAKTAALSVGQSTSFEVTVRNSSAVASPPITMIVFTFEQPMIQTFLQPTGCNGCTITKSPVGWSALQWPSQPPGDHQLTVTIKAIGHPTMTVGDNFEWLVALYAQPASELLDQPIDTSLGFALATGETTIHAH
jgi:hypothetical protein